MVNRLWIIATLAGTVLAHAPSIRAEDTLLANGSTAPFLSQAGPPSSGGPIAPPDAQPTNQGLGIVGPPPTFSQSLQGQRPPAAGGQSVPAAGPAPLVAGANGLVRLPSTAVASPSGAANAGVLPAPPQVVDGTYRDDGEYVTITLDGKETKLLKPRSMATVDIPGAPSIAGGTVRGRLMQNGRPLANCRVVILPLERDGKSYRHDANHEPLSTMTDNEGIYFFDHVPAAKYKLTWLPVGTNQWIRRVAIKPDVVVQPGQAATINTIGAAQRTIN